ncbi:uncharacterized protein LOC124446878 isoform X2 [Xenia sp. Carnegie-2017]|nr:uncharacterized protein LOC124446878 isoform X2 [Xenia sp. Carnegie-2017]
MENKNIRMEFDQMLKYYYSSNEQISDMEKALEKAAVKFSESQALVEKLEQDMAKIKLHYSLEVKELEMKVKSIESKSEHVQVVKPFHYHDDAVGKESPRNRAKDIEAPPKEHDVSNSKVQQRLLEEVEMTRGFRVLLDDLRGLMSHIKDFSVLIKERKDAVTMATVTRTAEFDDEESHANDGEHAKKMNPSKNDLKTVKRNSKIHRKSLKSEIETTSTFDVEKISRTSHEHTKNKSKRASKIRTPLHSSSPKGDGLESIEDITDVTDENGTNLDESDVRSVESRIEEVRTTGKRKSSKSNLPKNSFDMRSHIHPEDVETLLMPPEAQARSHGRAKEILDRLTLKGHELTHGNKKLAELISRQDDGIKKCWGAKTHF